jgi:pimeloyl-ACP methyl ester carboxylesterase
MDCGAVDVIASGFVLPPQRPLNELLADASGPPVLVFQGRLDPLGSSGRAEKFRCIIPAGRDAVVEVIEAGHCPHDECPALFCDTLTAWMCRISARDADAATATPQREPCSDLVR